MKLAHRITRANIPRQKGKHPRTRIVIRISGIGKLFHLPLGHLRTNLTKEIIIIGVGTTKRRPFMIQTYLCQTQTSVTRRKRLRVPQAPKIPVIHWSAPSQVAPPSHSLLQLPTLSKQSGRTNNSKETMDNPV